MSELPTIDPLKVAKREAEKLRSQVAEAFYRETQLEILAEALRDQRDEYEAKLNEALARVSGTSDEVHDITSVPAK